MTPFEFQNSIHDMVFNSVKNVGKTPFNLDAVDEKFENERDGEFDSNEKSEEEQRSERETKEQEENRFFKDK